MEAHVPVSDRVLTARYRLGDLLGRGGMAEVYDGFDERLHRPVAVKVLRPDLAADPTVRSRFEVEARAAAGLSHPNVVAVFDTGEDDGTPFIVMERLPGETLADHVAAGPVDQEWLRRVAGDVLAALGSAHAAGVVHRDVKPGNILIGENGCAKVADFGIAKSAEVAADITGTGMLIGTPAYLAPERLNGSPATPQSDLYSFGVVLYEALTGAKPFEGPTPLATAEAVLRQPLRPVADLRPDADPAFASAVERAMARDPAARPRSARAMAKELGLGRPSGPAPTVPLMVPEQGSDHTLVGAPLVGSGAGPRRRAGPAAASSPAAARLASWRRPSRPVAVLVAGAVVLLGVVLMAAILGGGRDGGSGDLAASIRDLGQRVEAGDGPMGPTASDRLDRVADQVEAGGGSDEATRLLADAAGWNASGLLSDQATAEMVELLGQIDGVDTSVATTTTTTTPTTAPPPSDQDEEDEGNRGRGRGKKGRD